MKTVLLQLIIEEFVVTTLAMADLKFLFVFACALALAGLSNVEAASRHEREVEAVQENNQLEKVQQQLMTAFDSLKKTMEDLASKLNTEDIVQGVQSLTSKLEGYAKQAADQFASTASGTASTETRKGDVDQQHPEAQPQPQI